MTTTSTEMQDADEALARRLAEDLNGPTTMRIGETSAQGARAYARVSTHEVFAVT